MIDLFLKDVLSYIMGIPLLKKRRKKSAACRTTFCHYVEQSLLSDGQVGAKVSIDQELVLEVDEHIT